MDTSRLPFRLDKAAGRGPLYRRLAAVIRAAVHAGEIGAGSRLPSERDLARSAGVSRTTAIAAYRALRDEGLLERVRGSGTRVVTSGRLVGPAVPAAETSTLKALVDPVEGVIDCSGSASADLAELVDAAAVPDDALRLDAASLRRLAAEFPYAPLGLPALRAAIAARHTRLGTPTRPEEVLVTTGAQQAIDLLFTLFCRPVGGGVVVTETPTYAGAVDAARLAGATVVGLPMDGGGMRARALDGVLDRQHVRLVYLMTSCQNPTGAVTSTSRRTEILRVCAARATPVIDDATLGDLVFTGPAYARPSGGDVGGTAAPPVPDLRPVDPGRLPAAHRRPAARADAATVITVGSLSKLVWAGLRVGWIRAPEHLIVRLARLKSVADLGSSQVSQLLAVRLLPSLDAIARVRRRDLAERLTAFSDLLRAELPAWSWDPPVGGPVLWIKLPAGDADDFARIALRHGVRVLPGSKAAPDGLCADRLRASYAVPRTALPVVVRRLARAWGEYEAGRSRGTDLRGGAGEPSV